METKINMQQKLSFLQSTHTVTLNILSSMTKTKQLSYKNTVNQVYNNNNNWLIDWLVFNVQRAIFQLYSGRDNNWCMYYSETSLNQTSVCSE
jgi:hypothetical protein